ECRGGKAEDGGIAGESSEDITLSRDDSVGGDVGGRPKAWRAFAENVFEEPAQKGPHKRHQIAANATPEINGHQAKQRRGDMIAGERNWHIGENDAGQSERDGDHVRENSSARQETRALQLSAPIDCCHHRSSTEIALSREKATH